MITATGLGSGLDISGLVTQLVASERAGSDLQISRQSSQLNAKLSALGSLKGVISGLQTSLSGLNTLSNFGKNTVTSSNPAVVTAVADSTAVANTYKVEVSKLATAQSMASPAFAASNTAVGTGTITFRTGTTDYDPDLDDYNGFTLNPDSKITTLTIDSSNNTLTGLMNAINAADFGVSASIINDGTGFRLLMSSDKTGLANSLEISVADSDLDNTDIGAAAGLSNFAFNQAATNLTQTSAATDAVFKLNGLSVNSAENTTSTAIPGVTLYLKDVSTTPLTLSVQSDPSGAVNAFNTFINSYNQFRKTVSNLTSFDSTTNTAGTLLGDFTVRAVVSQVEGVLRNQVSGLSGDFTSLGDVGLSTTKTGDFTLDQVKFKAALAAHPALVSKLFAALGVPEDGNITYAKSTASTTTGSYAVDITTVASAGTLTGSGVLPDFALGATLDIDSSNDNLTLNVDGVEVGEITLSAGTYSSGETLASELQARINGTAAMTAASKTVTVEYDATNANMVIRSSTYGNSSVVNITAVDTNSATSLGFDVADGTVGQDIAGTIGGLAASGAGQLLTGVAGNGAEGLGLFIAGSTTGARGNVGFSRGIADQLNTMLTDILSEEGGLSKRLDNITENQKALTDRKAALELKWQAVQDRYSRQFNALDSLLGNLNQTSSYLSTQLASLPGVVLK